MLFGWIVRKWLFRLCGIAWKNMMEFGRGGACVPARVALQGRIRRSSPAHNACIFGMETPLRERSGGHAGTAPTVSFGWIACGTVMSFGWITRKWIMEFGRSGYRCAHLFRPVKGTFHYFLKNRLARLMASLNWRGLMWKLGIGLRWLSVTSMVPSGCFVMMVSPPMMKP